MKMGKLAQKNKLLILVILVYAALFILSPATAARSFGNSLYYIKEMLVVLPVIFLLTVVIEAWVPKEVIMKRFGDNSGFTGNLLSLLLGSFSAGPVYAAFPVSKTLLGKGASIQNIVIILSSWAVIKVPMLVNEVKFLGVTFMIARWILTVIGIFAMAYLVAAIVKKEELPDLGTKQTPGRIQVRDGLCIGCGLCSQIAPRFFEMKNSKATLKAAPEGERDMETVLQAAQKCPTNAIDTHPAE